MRDGLRRMYGDDPEDISYYITAYNEPMVQPGEPENADIEGIVKGMHLISEGKGDPTAPHAQLLASGVGVPWALEAARLLAEDWGVVADVWSVTSWGELRRDGLECEEQAFLNADAPVRVPFVTQKLQGREGPVVATSDYMHAVPDQIRQWVPGDYVTLGADGFGFSDTRPAARRQLHIDAASMVVRTLQALAKRGEIDAAKPREAFDKYQLLDVHATEVDTAGGDA